MQTLDEKKFTGGWSAIDLLDWRHAGWWMLHNTVRHFSTWKGVQAIDNSEWPGDFFVWLGSYGADAGKVNHSWGNPQASIPCRESRGRSLPGAVSLDYLQFWTLHLHSFESFIVHVPVSLWAGTHNAWHCRIWLASFISSWKGSNGDSLKLWLDGASKGCT